MKKENHIALHSTSFIHEIKQIVTEARQKAYTAINSAMVEAYWLMGKRIVEEEQQGKERADYGTQLLKELRQKWQLYLTGITGGQRYYPQAQAVVSIIMRRFISIIRHC